MTAQRIVNVLFALLFLGVGAVSTVFLYRDYQHYDNLRSENRALSKQRTGFVDLASKKESELDRLHGDSEYIEAIIRTKLNYAKDGETVFRFEY